MLKFYKNLLNATFRDAQRHYLIEALKPLLPVEKASVLDIGTGNGEFAKQLQDTMPHLNITGVDVMDRGAPHIPVTLYDGNIIPFPDKSFDCVMLINMLHHTPDQKGLLAEAKRVTKTTIIIKDHYADNWFDHMTLLAMEYANPNAGKLLERPLKFLTTSQWKQLFAELSLHEEICRSDLVSYGKGWDLVFGRKMHFIGSYSLPT